MLQTMRNNAQGMLAKVIMGFIIVVFGLWGVESIVSIGGNEVAAIEVGGEKINESDIERAVERQRANLSRQFGAQFNEDLFDERFLRQAAIEQLVNEKVTVLQAQKLGLTAASRTIDESIVQEEAFQQNGRFDAEQFRDVLRMNGLTPSSFRAAMANDIIVNQAQAAFALTGIATDFQAQVNTMLANEERTFKFIEVVADDLLDQIKLSDEEIEEAYQQSKERFRTPELASVNYVEIKLADIAAAQEVTSAELEQAYEDYKKRQSVSEQRQASHILLELDGRSLTEAKATAQEIKQKLDAGADFAELAKEYSDDIGTKAIGGDLGISPRGSFDEAFEAALYALPEGGVSAPVETEFGVHIIKADKVLAADVEPFAAMEAELDREVRFAKAQQQYQQNIIDMSDMAFSAESIDDLAQQLNLVVQESELFTRDQGEGIAEDNYVRDAAYADNVLFDHELSPMIELRDSAIVLAIKEHQEESFKPLAEVQEQVVDVLKQQRAIMLAEKQAQQLALSGEGDWQTVTSTFSHSSDAPQAVQQRAFSLTKDNLDTVRTQNGYAAVKLLNIAAKNWEEAKADDLTKEMARLNNGRSDLFGYQNWAREVTKVKNKKSS